MSQESDRQTVRASHWILTWNNPTVLKHSCVRRRCKNNGGPGPCDCPEGESPYPVPITSQEDANELMNNELPENWKAEGQLEVGSEGTPHLQFFLKTPQVRFSAIKKLFPLCHIEVSKNPKKVENYCKKLDTRLVDSNQTDKTDPDQKYTTKDFWRDLALVWPDFEDISEDEMECFDAATRYLIDCDIPCWMLAVQPQVRKAFLLYGRRIMISLDKSRDVSEINELIVYGNDERRRQESREVDAPGSEDSSEDEGSCEDEEDSEGEDCSDSGQSSDSSDQESDEEE